jgi:hypothetical protein
MLLRKIMRFLTVHQIKLTHFDTANGGGVAPTTSPRICVCSIQFRFIIVMIY